MTRAADRLIVCGADGVRQRPNGCWYNLVCEALGPLLVAEGENDEKVLLYRKRPAGAVAGRAPSVATAAAAANGHELPEWLRRPAPIEMPRPTAISPSSAFAEEIDRFARTGTAADRQRALKRGLIVHRLLQSLPDIATDRRRAAVERYLARAAADFLPAEQAEIARQVLVILNDLVFAEAFAPGSRAEVPIVGRIARIGAAPLAVSGQVDRLAVTPDSVLIADYKSDRAAPRELGGVPKAYIGQLALYRAVLAGIYPAKTIRAALVFTEGPNIIEVPGAAMEAGLIEIIESNHEPSHAPVKLS
jgi:ATP-dependent helicase/nuclease subunit A